MTVTIYTKPGCAICESAKQKLRLMAVPFEERDLDAEMSPAATWRGNGRIGLRAQWALIGERVPMILIDGEAYDYAGAMRELKKGG